MIKGFAHVCIGSADLDATERFYCGALGLKKHFNFIRKGEVIGYYLRTAGGDFLEVFRQEAVQYADSHSLRHFCLEVDDVDETIRRLRSYGYEATEKVLGADQSWQAWTTDPNGVKIEFHEYTDKSAQRTGGDCVLPG